MTTKRQATGPRGLAAALAKATRATFRRRGFAQAGVLTKWAAIVGDELAARSCPEKLTFPPGAGTGGTLHLRVTGSFATELQHLEPVVIERVNTFFGSAVISRIALKQGPLPERREARRPPPRPLGADEEAALAERVAATADHGLRRALLDLGRRVAGRSPGPGPRRD